VEPNEFESGGALVRSESGGHRSGAKRRKNFFIGRAPALFGSKSTISRFGECFCNGQYSLVSFLFAVPCAQPFIKVGGGTCPRAPWSRRNWLSVPHRAAAVCNNAMPKLLFNGSDWSDLEDGFTHVGGEARAVILGGTAGGQEHGRVARRAHLHAVSINCTARTHSVFFGAEFDAFFKLSLE